jgi:hypothetical protein
MRTSTAAVKDRPVVNIVYDRRQLALIQRWANDACISPTRGNGIMKAENRLRRSLFNMDFA